MFMILSVDQLLVSKMFLVNESFIDNHLFQWWNFRADLHAGIFAKGQEINGDTRS